MKLSILIPSKRPEGLESFLRTFRANTANPQAVELMILVDDKDEYVEYAGNITTIHRIPTEPISIGVFLQECYRLCSGDWIMFCNDDIKIDTYDWDSILFKKMEEFPDEMALFWPNDGMFGSNLSCFPIISRKALEAIEFFPVPFQRYKIDDTLHYVFPFNRRVYIPEILFRHGNLKYVTPGGISPTDPAAMNDSLQWIKETSRREEMRKALLPYANPVKILIAASTGEYARRADFYDYMNMLEKPAGSILMYSHDRSPAAARNVIFQQAIDYQCTHVLLVDDDMAFRSNALAQLLEHDKDIVSGLYLGRAYPHKPLIFDLADDTTGSCAYVNLNDSTQGGRLKRIVAAGFGFCLIKVSILDRMEQPWVRLGELDPQQWCDDIGFFNRARKSGIESWCDMECRVGHIGTMIVWPNFQDGMWFTGYDTGQGSINVPQPVNLDNIKSETPETDLLAKP
jgi:glycosyltransferase involved in cell wall biosynthesis